MGKKNEDADNDDDHADGADDKCVAAADAARGNAASEEEKERRGGKQGPVAHSELAVAQLAEKKAEPLKAVAADADAETRN